MEIDGKGQSGFYSGTSGLVLPVKNKQFYPVAFQDKSRLTYYASLFNSIEINSSFYKIPMPSTVAKWAEQVPEHFRFTFKLWREITHVKGLAFDPVNVERFMHTIDQVGNKKGCLLVQFPPSLKVDNRGQLEKLLICIAEADPACQWKVAVEFRHRSWYREDIYDLIEKHQAVIVIHDKPGSATPITATTAEFKYLRFHGPNGDYKGHYSEEFLEEYGQMITEWCQDKQVVYVYFNNTMGDAVRNLDTLNTVFEMNHERSEN